MIEGPLQKPARRTLSEELQALLPQEPGQGVTVGRMFEVLAGRGYAVLIIMLALPFCLPIPLLAIAPFFMIFLVLFGGRLALGLKPWLPERMLEKEISYVAIYKVVTYGKRLARRLEPVLHPRWLWLSCPEMLRVHGITVVYLSLLLSLPIPLTNAIPAVAIVLLALGMLERDGLFIFCGYVMTAVCSFVFGLLFWLGKAGAQALWERFFG
jgi:hypothetical protein